jgi:hypothetical protein
MVDPLPPEELRPDHRRRSKRVKIRIAVVVRSQEKRALSEKTHTLLVNAHGALLLLGIPVSVDKFVVLENPHTGQEILCRVTHVGTQFMGKAQVGIEFIKPAPEFWGISPRPDDWAPGRAGGRANDRTSKKTPQPVSK